MLGHPIENMLYLLLFTLFEYSLIVLFSLKLKKFCRHFNYIFSISVLMDHVTCIEK